MSENDYPLSLEQESIWIAERFARGPSPYGEHWAQRLRGHLDVDALTSALDQIVHRHPALRSRFLLVDDRVVQRVLPEVDLVVERVDWRDRNPDEALREAAHRPMDTRDTVLRVGLYELAADDHILLVQCHHIVVDDYSFEVLAGEIEQLYTAAVLGRRVELPPPATSPGEYATNQRSRGIAPASLDYWARVLDGAQPLSELPPVRRPLRSPRGNSCGRVTATMDGDDGNHIRRRARAMRTTPTVVLLASLAMALSAAVGIEDILLGQAVSRRGAAELEDVVGCFTDIMPLRLYAPRDSAFADVCAATKQAVISALGHRDVPLAAIVKRLRSPRRALSGDGLVRVVLVVDETKAWTLPGLECERIFVVPWTTKFDWCVFAVDKGDGYHFYVDYASDNFTPDEATAALQQWNRTLVEVSDDPTVTVDALRQTLGALV